MNPKGFGIRGRKKTHQKVMRCAALNPQKQYLCTFVAGIVINPVVLVGGPSVIKTGFPKDWRGHAFL